MMIMLSSCAYHPMYGKTHGNGHTKISRAGSHGLSEVEIANISDRAGQILRNDLIDRINYAGYSDKTYYLLEVSLSETRTNLGIKVDNTSSLYVYKINAKARLRDKQTGKIVKSFTVKAESTVNVIKEQFSILMASETGRKRALKQVADQIVNRLGLYFSTQGRGDLEH